MYDPKQNLCQRMTRSEIAAEVARMCARLDAGLQTLDVSDGWTDAHRRQLLQYFRNVEADLRAGRKISFFSLVRALDSMGISEGQLLEEACRLNNAVNALNK
jgi:hypothetical protein